MSSIHFKKRVERVLYYCINALIVAQQCSDYVWSPDTNGQHEKGRKKKGIQKKDREEEREEERKKD